jgi:hypothetical protein
LYLKISNFRLKKFWLIFHIVKDLPYQTTDVDQPNADFYIKPKQNELRLSGDGGENALNNWAMRMSQRKNIQVNISSNLI